MSTREGEEERHGEARRGGGGEERGEECARVNVGRRPAAAPLSTEEQGQGLSRPPRGAVHVAARAPPPMASARGPKRTNLEMTHDWFGAARRGRGVPAAERASGGREQRAGRTGRPAFWQKISRHEGGIEPLGRQAPTDLKSVPRATQDHHGMCGIRTPWGKNRCLSSLLSQPNSDVHQMMFINDIPESGGVLIVKPRVSRLSWAACALGRMLARGARILAGCNTLSGFRTGASAEFRRCNVQCGSQMGRRLLSDGNGVLRTSEACRCSPPRSD